MVSLGHNEFTHYGLIDLAKNGKSGVQMEFEGVQNATFIKNKIKKNMEMKKLILGCAISLITRPSMQNTDAQVAG